ncbi:bifunctional folylpolyglutamate synthase/dihydrofolate synthase [Pseudolysinimonas sp.]|uniref:bifunctional folylpolyglutamate synthase/dihydrofolate synthase n=1 Tax=Pseudolysinimonas sp. TaxID=2680009 RepID=UPI003F80D4D7
MSDPIDDDPTGEWRDAADEVYRELLERIGEAAPQPRLEPTRRAVELLGDPQRSAPVVHITGTNGKTSTSRMIESLLRASGLKTGLLTSPHLVRVTERIMIDGRPVSDEAFARNWDDIQPYLAMTDAELIANDEPPLSFFEALTVLAFAIFADAPVDVMVLEVGMGGEWDSTNVADGQVAVFTPIALDHVERLGRTIGEIARTKAGIIKPAASVVTAIQPLEALDELRAAAAHDEAHVAVERVDFALEGTTVAVGGQVIDVRGRAGEYHGIYLPLYGDHQAQNATIAIAAVESFLGDGSRALDADVVAEGLATATSPGRLQLVGTEPTVIVDAAHNPHGAAALAEAITEYFDFDEITVVVGILREKDAHGIVAELAPFATQFFVTTSTSERARPADELADIVSTVAPADIVFTLSSPELAFASARDWAAAAPRRAVVVTGSITLVGEAIAAADAEGWKPRGEGVE